MSTTLPTGQPSASPSQSPSTRSALRGVLLLAGTLILVAMLTVGGVRIAAVAGSQDHSGTFDASGPVQTLTVHASAVDVQVRYGDVPRAEVSFDQQRPDARLRHSEGDGELRIDIGSRFRGFGGFGDGVGWGGYTGRSALIVTLPQAQTGTDLDLRLTASEIDLEGDFGAVDLRLTATDLDLRGSADSVSAVTTASNLTTRNFATDGEVDLNATAGNVQFSTAEVPSAIALEATATNVRFAIPAGEYEIRTDATAGSVRNNVTSTAGAERIYRFTVTASDVQINELN